MAALQALALVAKALSGRREHTAFQNSSCGRCWCMYSVRKSHIPAFAMYAELGSLDHSSRLARTHIGAEVRSGGGGRRGGRGHLNTAERSREDKREHLSRGRLLLVCFPAAAASPLLIFLLHFPEFRPQRRPLSDILISRRVSSHCLLA